MSAGLHSRDSGPTERRPWWIGILVVVLLLVGIVAWRNLAGADEEAGCEGATSHARLVASPDIAPALKEIASSLEDERNCVSIRVDAVPSDEVLNLLSTGSDDQPDLWVPDSDVWARQLAEDGIAVDTIVPAIATSPVVLVGGPAADAPTSWLTAASSGMVAMQNPLDSTPSALALVALRAEQSDSGATDSELETGLVSAAQHYGQQSTDKSVDNALSAITASSKRFVPVTEQQFLRERTKRRSLQAMVPETGTLMQKYPLLGIPGRAQEANAAAAQFVDYLQRPQGDVSLAASGFRPADGSPFQEGRGVGEVATLKAPEASMIEKDLRAWQVLAVPSSLLVVLDASGSMDFDTGSGTRMELAADAAGRALEAFPGSARIGLWLFSIDLGGRGVDHQVMSPLRRLDAKTKAGTQRQELGAMIKKALTLTEGGTGLYDTTLAAYRNAVKNYDDDYFNSVVLMTDGANEDPGSIELDELLSTLRAESDPSKPVRVIAIGISKDADMKSLEKIADATNGQAFSARDPRQILQVMAQALLAR